VGMNIADGTPLGGTASTSSAHPGVAGMTQAFGPVTTSPGQMGTADTIGPQQARLAAGQADMAAAQTAGHATEAGRRTHYEADMTNVGTAAYGDQIVVPVVPDMALPPASSGLYPYAGDEPIS
jgi:hypothetical protein